ncbi:MAG: hypothetical protein ACUVTX_04155 [Bacteroidales bacterium]
MNSLLKIKILTILFAWLIMFLHNIIPHNHVDEQPYYCHNLIHNISRVNHNHGQETELNARSDNQSKVCHFSPVFCHPQYFGEQTILTSLSSFEISFTDISEKFHIPDQDEICNPFLKGSHLLRAPPYSL